MSASECSSGRGCRADAPLFPLFVAFAAGAGTALLLLRMSAVRRRRRFDDDGDDDCGPPRSILECERAAREVLRSSRPWTWSICSYSSGEGTTLRRCRDAFDGIRLIPRILTEEVAEAKARAAKEKESGAGVDPCVKLFGDELRLPVLVAPSSHHAAYDPKDGEVGTARGAGRAGAGYCYNFLLADRHHSEVVKEEGVKWLHLYFDRPRKMMSKILEVTGCGKSDGNDGSEGDGEGRCQYSAIVLTCDHPHDRVQKDFGRYFLSMMKTPSFWPDLLRYRNTPMYGNQGEVGGEGRSMLDITVAFFRKGLEAGPRNSSDDDVPLPPTWDTVAWIKSQTDLPVVVKGVLSPSDAIRAVESGADAVVVSNHGGRQVDGTVPAIEALPAVVAALRERFGGERAAAIPVLVDTGVRSSADVMRALALGATAVLLGRPALWALTCGGADGVKAMLDRLREDLIADMTSLGVASVDGIDESLIWPPDRERIASAVRACGSPGTRSGSDD